MSTTLDLIINELKELQSQIHTLEGQKIAAEKERDDKSKELEYLESENKRYVFDSMYGPSRVVSRLGLG